MKIKYELKDKEITLSESEIKNIHEYYEAACTAEYMLENYPQVKTEEQAMELGYEVRRQMSKYGYDESEAISKVLKEASSEHLAELEYGAEENINFCNGSVVMATYRWLLSELSTHMGIAIYEEEGQEKGVELETWTVGGVDMITFIDFRGDLEGNRCNPYTLVELFRKWADEFDIDDTIRMHMEGESYRATFTYADAVKDFTAYQEEMKGYADELEGMLLFMEEEYNLTPELCEGIFFSLEDLYKGMNKEEQV